MACLGTLSLHAHARTHARTRPVRKRPVPATPRSTPVRQQHISMVQRHVPAGLPHGNRPERSNGRVCRHVGIAWHAWVCALPLSVCTHVCVCAVSPGLSWADACLVGLITN